jgi:4,5-DOPA dioxygenase extradiol
MSVNTTGRMPALYLSHGAPPLVDDRRWVDELSTVAARLPRPTAILVVSAHWESAPLMLGATGPTPLVYDFGGFEQRFHVPGRRRPGAADVPAHP